MPTLSGLTGVGTGSLMLRGRFRMSAILLWPLHPCAVYTLTVTEQDKNWALGILCEALFLLRLLQDNQGLRHQMHSAPLETSKEI